MVMSNLLKVQIVKGVQIFGFWVPTIYLFYSNQGYTPSEIFSLLSMLQLFIVAFEYPTGIVGDLYGPKSSVLMGYIFLTISFFLMGLLTPIPYALMIVILGCLAMGISFVSGSDVALLYDVSSDFKKDSATSNQISSIFQITGFIIGGFVASINLGYPFLLSGITSFIAILILLTVKENRRKEDRSGNIMEIAIQGVKESLNIKIFLPMFISSVVVMYLLSEKWIIAPVFESINLPIPLYGIMTAVIFSFKGFASTFYKKYGNIHYGWLIFGLTISALLISFQYISILGLILVYMFSGYIINQSDVLINEKISSNSRSSVMSFRNLFSRLLNSPYLWVISLASGSFALPLVNIIMVSVLVLVIITVYIVYKARGGNVQTKNIND